jgi:hypothetical protein
MEFARRAGPLRLVVRRPERDLLAARINIYCLAGESGLPRDELAARLESFFGRAISRFETASGSAGFGLYYELAAGEDPDTWADRLRPYLAGIGVPPGTKFDVFPDGYERGLQWRRVEVFGQDRRRTDRPVPPNRD